MYLVGVYDVDNTSPIFLIYTWWYCCSLVQLSRAVRRTGKINREGEVASSTTASYIVSFELLDCHCELPKSHIRRTPTGSVLDSRFSVHLFVAAVRESSLFHAAVVAHALGWGKPHWCLRLSSNTAKKCRDSNISYAITWSDQDTTQAASRADNRVDNKQVHEQESRSSISRFRVANPETRRQRCKIWRYIPNRHNKRRMCGVDSSRLLIWASLVLLVVLLWLLWLVACLKFEFFHQKCWETWHYYLVAASRHVRCRLVEAFDLSFSCSACCAVVAFVACGLFEVWIFSSKMLRDLTLLLGGSLQAARPAYYLAPLRCRFQPRVAEDMSTAAPSYRKARAAVEKVCICCKGCILIRHCTIILVVLLLL